MALPVAYINTAVWHYLPVPPRGVRGLANGAGSGAGTGGGSGGAIRDAGGAFGKRAVAQEEQYFRKLVRLKLCLTEGFSDERTLYTHTDIYIFIIYTYA